MSDGGLYGSFLSLRGRSRKIESHFEDRLFIVIMLLQTLSFLGWRHYCTLVLAKAIKFGCFHVDYRRLQTHLAYLLTHALIRRYL